MKKLGLRQSEIKYTVEAKLEFRSQLPFQCHNWPEFSEIERSSPTDLKKRDV
jgi:hypothetical protein